MSERKIRTFHIPIDRVRQYLTVEEIEACVGGHVKCAIYADVEAGRKLILGNGIRALLGLADSAVEIKALEKKLSDAIPSKEMLLDVIQGWQFAWMDVKGTDEQDRKNYFNRAFGIDANMRHDLAKRLREAMEGK